METSETEAFNEIVWNYYRYHAWGDTSHREVITRLQLEAEPYFNKIWNAREQLSKARQDGLQAKNYADELKQKLATEKLEEVDLWLERQSDLPGRVVKYLSQVRAKFLEGRLKAKARNEANKGFLITAEPPGLQNGLHPNDISNLTPCNDWTIAIDETGLLHAADMSEESSDEKIGKYVALIVPTDRLMTSLGENFHAIDEGHARIEEVLSTIVESRAGVFGFSVSDPVSTGLSWYLQIDLLVRWVLRLLPLDPAKRTTVRVEIEQRGEYTPDRDLSLTEESMLDELKNLSPERFSNLQLRMKFVPKNGSQLNGYVDTIANCWGSPNRIRRSLLTHFKFLDTCLLTPSAKAAIERTLIGIRDSRPLMPADWYQLVATSNSQGRYSLVDDVLRTLGDRAKHSVELWYSYLDEIRVRIARKELEPASLSRAISWLQEFKPGAASVPPSVDLQFQSAELAIANHLGRSVESHLQKTMAAAFALLEEDAQLCCEVILRSVVALSNAYNFDMLNDYVDSLIDEPIKVVGLSNYGKLLSTRGQLSAFNAQNQRALELFDQAIGCFEKLSDTKQRDREMLQTQAYRVAVLLDDCDEAGDKAKIELEKYLQSMTGSSLDSIIGYIGQWAGTRRFAHHLVLRAMVAGILDLKTHGQVYFDSRADWADGDEHPWQLINFYRGVIAARLGYVSEAKPLIARSLALAFEHDSGTVYWIGLVLENVARGLDLLPPSWLPRSSNEVDELEVKLPNAPWAELDKLKERELALDRVDQILKPMLPFNFR